MRRREFLLFSAVSLSLAACAEGDDPAGAASGDASVVASDGASRAAGVATKSVWQAVERVVPIFGGSASFAVGPAVRSGENVIVRVAATTTDIEESDGLHVRWSRSSISLGMADLMLVDVDGQLVYRQMDDRSFGISLSVSSPVEVYPVFGGIEADEVTLFVPSVGVFSDIPVFESGDEQAFDAGSVLAEAQLDADRSAGIGLETFSESFAGDLDTSQDDESTTVNLTSDVLFASDSFELSAGADESLQVVADRLEDSGSGVLTIVGHTDDVDTEAYNQTLSEERARAVHDRLGELVDLSGWDVSVVGKGESEPRMEGTSDEARAANRRVEIVIEADQAAQVQAAVDAGELPETSGPVGVGSEGVDVSFEDGDSAHISLGEVTRLGDYLAGEIHVTNTGSDNSFLLNSLISTLGLNYNQRRETVNTLDAGFLWSFALLANGNRNYAVDYRPYGKDGVHLPVADAAGGWLEPGEEIVLPVVWPDTGQDTVTLDLQSRKERLDMETASECPFRLTDIPVVDA